VVRTATLKLGNGNDFDITNASDVSIQKFVYEGIHDSGTSTFEDFELAINTQTGTTYSLTAGDSGKLVTLDNGSGITLTVPDSLPAGWHCMIEQLGAGQVTVAGGGSMNIRNRQTHTKLAGQYAMGTLVVTEANECYLGGDTAA
jgi:predicted secreted protein